MSQNVSPPFTLFQRKGSKNWSVRFSMKGRQIRKSLETDDERQAQRKAYEVWAEASYRAKSGLEPTVMPFSKMAEAFIEQLLKEVERDERSTHHARDWPPVIRRYLVGFFGDRPVDAITEADLERYVEWRRTYWTDGPGKDITHIRYERNGRALKRGVKRETPSLSRQRGELVIVRSVFSQATKWGYVRSLEVPAIKVRRRVDNRRPSFEPDEYARLIETSLSRLVDPIMLHTDPADARITKAKDGRQWRLDRLDDHTRRDRIALHCYIEISALTGMRPTESKNLNWGDVLGYRDARKKPIGERDIRVRVRGKGKSGTLVPQLAALTWFDMLWDVFEKGTGREPIDEDPVFANIDGSRIQSFKKSFSELLRVCDLQTDHRGVRRTSYSLRHFHLSQQLAHGVPIHDLARNTRTSITMIDKHYAQVQVERMKDSLRPEWGAR
ncbi:site-specific integrase [Fulvimarina sp. 2208YS6-2-32]|uniref:Site-specific integrase n=1 Tax=Fulvimarina uroteuthidis TaxID=3098149 RepID=A0ABU5I6M2_9HYPH|nr:site-specific integrase [Fulvimarina sp. 2208YS6-2-32]MDY8110770.1 site-specific integrase [Fulvimarina sp. 2208YS6-2-32]